jgi:hypothetical protein
MFKVNQICFTRAVSAFDGKTSGHDRTVAKA